MPQLGQPGLQTLGSVTGKTRAQGKARRCWRPRNAHGAPGAGQAVGGRGRPYQINERQKFPAPSVGLMRGHFDGLVIAQDRAIGQQDRHPQHLAGDKRHVRERPGRAGRRGGRAGGARRTGASAVGTRTRTRRDAGRGLRLGACPAGPARPRAPWRPARAGCCLWALPVAGCGQAGGVASSLPSPSSFCSGFRGARETRPGAPSRRPGKG